MTRPFDPTAPTIRVYTATFNAETPNIMALALERALREYQERYGYGGNFSTLTATAYGPKLDAVLIVGVIAPTAYPLPPKP